MNTSELLAELHYMRRYYELRGRKHFESVMRAAIRYIERSEQRIENITRGSSALLVQAAELVGERMTGRKG